MTHPVTYNFQSQPRGDNFLGIHIFLFDSANVALDLTGCNCKMQLRRTPGNKIILEWSTYSQTISVSTNEIYVKERSGTIMDIPDFKYLYDIQLIYSDGFIDTILKGLFPIDADITR